MSKITFLEVETGPSPTFSVIWMHGLGADGSDFEPIVSELELEDLPAVRFVFPNAPHRPVTCNAGYVMRAWYDIISLEPHQRKIDEAGLIQSRDIVRQLIAHEIGRGVPTKHIFLAGFSQGGAVAYLSALTHPEPLAGVIALSTYIPSAELITAELSDKNTQLPMFVAHGIDDDVVSPALGSQALELVQQLGFAPNWETYEMGHSVCIEEVKDIGNWLKRQINRLK